MKNYLLKDKELMENVGYFAVSLKDPDEAAFY